MKTPVDHILRPRLPWRAASEPAITECGYDASKVNTLTRDEFSQRLKDLGKTRLAMVTCMTCSDTAQRWGTWEKDPRKAVQREIDWECGWRRSDKGMRLQDELFAIAGLIEAHQEEFSALVASVEQRRNWLGMKEKHKRAAAQEAPKGPRQL